MPAQKGGGGFISGGNSTACLKSRLPRAFNSTINLKDESGYVSKPFTEGSYCTVGILSLTMILTISGTVRDFLYIFSCVVGDENFW